nr:L,D-transpeptidase family protein [Kibdelosporangium sp. MJ126-NF4]CEL17074.1 hypothetical protein [Kibdelosporangium sp. MJ126-NF4]CTQ91696.1 hypothetical protein [Kibdelosporangium sp. MJ126-NF4]
MRRRLALPAVVVIALLVVGVGTFTALAPTVETKQERTVEDHEMKLLAAFTSGPEALRALSDEASEQVITVSAPDHSATTAKLSAWAKGNGAWRREIGPVDVFVGTAGVGETNEGLARTPAGAFRLTEAFGIRPNNGTRLPYFTVDEHDWWVSDVKSAEYNKHFRCPPGKCPFNERAGERLVSAGPVYDHAVVIDYNRGPVTPGAGSAFFLHVSAGKPTAGCVAVPAEDLTKVMRWLDPARKPSVTIG